MSTITINNQKKVTTVPALRFQEFVGEWKETLLNDVAEFRKGKGISKSDIVEDGNLECIRYGELYTIYNEVIKDIISKTNLPIKTLELSQHNDVIIPASGETQLDIATASCVLKSGVALSGDLNIIRSSLNGIFLSFYLNNNKKLEIAKLAQGSSVVHLYSSQLKSLKLNIPTFPEQQKIASFLSVVDEKIQQLSRKKELLEQYKKGVMQKLFSGKLRFKNENGEDYPDWEEKKLREVANRIVRKNKENDLNVLTISAQLGLVSQLEYFNKPVSAKDVTNYYLLERNDFAYNKSYSNGYPMGAIKRLKKYDKGVVSTLYICFCFDENISLNFMEQYFEFGLHNKEIEKVAQEGARNHGLLNIGVNDFLNISLITPSIQEQQKIASFLSSIDIKIKNTNRQITQTQKFKKGLLQQMFV
jgi:type I restriction enzyme, S subunit